MKKEALIFNIRVGHIVSHDIFIELNATWFHGKHFFDANNTADVRLLNLWETKAESSHLAYKEAIYRWTVNDPLKLKTAIQNGLNYMVFWDNDLTDFHIWLENYGYTETDHTA